MPKVENIVCPVCDFTHRTLSLVVHIPSTPWTDDCACCDQGTCVKHKYSNSNYPVRPSEEVMLKRAQQRTDRRTQQHLDRQEEINKRLEEIRRQAYLEGFEDASNNGAPRYELLPKECDKCNGEGWLWWNELAHYNGPAADSHDCYSDDTRYPCDNCDGTGKV